MDKRYQIFVSSTFADLKEERAKVIQTIMELDCIPAGMEIFPAIDEEQFTFIKRIIDDCDYYILIIGGRYGTLSEDGISYTEKEYNYAIEKGIKVLGFLHSNPDIIPIGKSEKEAGLREKLEQFRNKVATNRLIKFWERADELPGLVALSLSKTIKTYPATGWVRGNLSAGPETFKEMSDLRKENAELKSLLNQQTLIDKINDDKNIAGLDDKITVNGKTHSFKYGDSQWHLEITWGKIFSLIAPFLLEFPADKKVSEYMTQTLWKEKKTTTSGVVSLDEQDFQTIKIHLKSIGLIALDYSKTSNGGHALFWSLTDIGEKLLLKLRTVGK